MSINAYLIALRRTWVFLLAATLTGLATGAAWLLIQPVEYSSTARVYVAPGAAQSLSDLSQGNSYTEQIVASYAAVATTPYVLQPVVDRLNLRESAAQLARHVNTTVATDATVLNITSTDASPAGAAEIANTVARSLILAAAELTPSTQDAGKSAVKLTLIQQAEIPARSSSPNVTFALLMGATVGLFVALAAVAALVQFDTRIRSAEILKERFEDPVLGQIAFDSSAATQPLIYLHAGDPVRHEAFNTLRTNLRFLLAPNSDGGRVYVISSASAGEGKTTTAASLALAAADKGERVVIVDSDLRRPRLASVFGIEGGVGLTDVLAGSVRLEDALQPWGNGALDVLPSGTEAPNPSALTESGRMRDLLSELRKRYQLVIVDTPPLLPVVDAAALGANADGVLLVVAADQTRAPQLHRAVEILSMANAPFQGFVFTKVRPRAMQNYAYAYSYGDDKIPSRATERRQKASAPGSAHGEEQGGRA